MGDREGRHCRRIYESEMLRGLGGGEKKMELKKMEWERLCGLILILDPDP